MGDLSVTIEYALAQQGKPYSIAPNRFGPYHFDCSGFTWTSMSVGGFDPPSYAGVSSGALMWGFNSGTVRSSPDVSVGTFGDLLIRGGLDGAGPKGHIAFSLGDGRTMEAMGTAYGVRIGSAYGRNWSHGMQIPGVHAPKPGIDWAAIAFIASLLQGDPAMPKRVSYRGSSHVFSVNGQGELVHSFFNRPTGSWPAENPNDLANQSGFRLDQLSPIDAVTKALGGENDMDIYWRGKLGELGHTWYTGEAWGAELIG